MRGHCTPLAIMAVPEAPVNLDHPALGAISKVRRSGKGSNVPAVSNTQRSESACNPFLRRGSLLANPRHGVSCPSVERLHQAQLLQHPIISVTSPKWSNLGGLQDPEPDRRWLPASSQNRGHSPQRALWGRRGAVASERNSPQLGVRPGRLPLPALPLRRASSPGLPHAATSPHDRPRLYSARC